MRKVFFLVGIIIANFFFLKEGGAQDEENDSPWTAGCRSVREPAKHPAIDSNRYSTQQLTRLLSAQEMSVELARWHGESPDSALDCRAWQEFCLSIASRMERKSGSRRKFAALPSLRTLRGKRSIGRSRADLHFS